MTNKIKKSGQKIAKRFVRFSKKARTEGKTHLYENLISRTAHIRDVRLHIVEWGLMILVVILLTFAQTFWYTDSYSITTFKPGGVYTEATLGKVDSLNPLFASTNSEKSLVKLLFSSLIENDYSGHPGIGLAQSIISSEDGKIWTVRLKDNLKWSDNEPITNSDVLFTIGLIKNPAVSSIYSSSLSGVSVSEDEVGNLIFTLPSPYADFNSALDFPILPEHILADTDPKLLLESSFSKNPVSSGPFTFNASQSIGNNGEVIIYLSANANFHKKQPELSSFAIHAFPDEEAIIAAVNSGSVTATADLSLKAEEKISSERTYTRSASINSGVFAFFNTSSSAFSDKTTRQAIQKGINVSSLREIAKTNSPLDYPILPSQADSSSWPTIPEQNTEAAKAELATSELAQNSLPVSIVTVNNGYLPEVAEAFAAQLRDLGINAEVSAYDLSQEFILNIVGPRAYDIFIYEVELGTKPDLFPYYHSSQAKSSGLNFSNYNNPIVNDLILAARSTTDKTLQDAKYASFLKYWVTDVPAIALYQSNMTYFYNKNVRTFSEDLRLSIPTDRFSEVEYWAVEKTTLNRTP